MPENLDCTKEILAVMEKENKTDEVFYAKTKRLEHTPVHTICSNVFSNKYSAAEKLDAMLASASSHWRRNDISLKNVLECYNKEGLTPLHLLCKRERDFGLNSEIGMYELISSEVNINLIVLYFILNFLR